MDDTIPTEAECIRAAGEIYGAILADPKRAERIRAHRAGLDKQGNVEPPPSSEGRTTLTRADHINAAADIYVATVVSHGAHSSANTRSRGRSRTTLTPSDMPPSEP